MRARSGDVVFRWSHIGMVACLTVALTLASVDVAADPPANDPPSEPVADVADEGVGFGGYAQVQVSGTFGDNVGVLGGPELLIGDHAIGLSLFVGGGTHLRTGAQLRYRLQIIDALAWWIAPGIAFDVLFVNDVTVWSRLTSFSTGVEVSLGDMFYLGVDFTVLPRVAPLSVTFVDDGDNARQLEHGLDELPYDLAFGVLRPGVSFGIRL